MIRKNESILEKINTVEKNKRLEIYENTNRLGIFKIEILIFDEDEKHGLEMRLFTWNLKDINLQLRSRLTQDISGSDKSDGTLVRIGEVYGK